MIDDGPRHFCGRVHRPPLLTRLMDHLGYHRELYYLKGTTRVRTRWVASARPGRSIYTCRKPKGHWRMVVRPAGERMVKATKIQRGAEVPAHIKNTRVPYWKAKSLKETREEVTVPYPARSWEIGHRYEFTRWEEYAWG
jgi:hypothetical protein